jgi:tripartite-type tricarboxylate transporter receptor subunit TctC
MLHVQYKGAAPAVVDLLGGHVMLRFDQVTTSLAHIRSGKLRALAVTSRQRSKVLPDVPTIEESGLKPFHDTTFNGVMAPAGTPRDIVERLHTEVTRAVATPALRDKFAQQGIELVASRTPEEFAAFLRQHAQEFGVLAKEAHIRMQ